MNEVSTQIWIIFGLLLLNGLFSMSEMAVVSARKTRLQQKAEEGDSGSARALALAQNPNRFLSTVQIGITLISILSGAFGGEVLAGRLQQFLAQYEPLAPYSEALGLALVVILITFFSLVIGELVPKRLALNSAERIARWVAPLMHFLSVLSAPLVMLLSATTDFVLWLLRVKPSNELDVTEDDLKNILDQGTEAGILEESEQDMVERIFRLSDRNVSALMTPRTDVVFLDVDSDHEEIHQKIASQSYSRFPVFKNTHDNVIGIVHARDLLLKRVENPNFDLASVMQQPLFVPESTAALEVLERFKSSGAEMAIVIDEYGGVMGVVSLKDIFESIVGDVSSPAGSDEAEAIQREDGSWLFDGMILIDELKDHLQLKELPDEDDGDYETLSGLIMSQLGRVPVSGDYFDWDQYRFEVVDMDRHKVDKVLVCLRQPAP